VFVVLLLCGEGEEEKILNIGELLKEEESKGSRLLPFGVDGCGTPVVIAEEEKNGEEYNAKTGDGGQE
jgi:hypothetical protein